MKERAKYLHRNMIRVVMYEVIRMMVEKYRERERIELIADQGVELFDQFVSLRYFNQPNWLPSIKFRGRS